MGKAKKEVGGARGKHTKLSAAAKTRYDKFIEAYISNNSNGAQAAVDAGFSKKTARNIAHDLLTVPYIAERLAARSKVLAEKFQLRSEDTLRRLKGLRDVSLKEMFNEDGSAKSPHELSDEVAMLIDGVEMTETSYRVGKRLVTERVYKYKVTRKGGAVDMAMRHHGLYAADDSKGGTPDEFAQRVRAKLAEIEDATEGKP